MKIKEIINENNIKWLFETDRIVDNVDRITNDIVDNFVYNLTKGICYKKAYNLKDNIIEGDFVLLKTPYKVPSPTFQHYSRHATVTNFKVMVNMLVCICKSEDEVEYYRQNGMFYSTYTHNNGTGIPQLNVGFWILNGKTDIGKLKHNISHELSHLIQSGNNTNLKNEV